MQSTLEMATRTARQSGGCQIHRLRLRVGAMSGVVPDALHFAFEALRPGTLAAGATLEIETAPVRCWCAECRREFTSEDLLYECPQCHRLSAELRGGLELELVSLDVS